MEIGQSEPLPPVSDRAPLDDILPNMGLDPTQHQGTSTGTQAEDLSALLEGLEAEVARMLGSCQDGSNNNLSQVDKSLYTAVHNWSSHRHSHSLSRSQTNVKQRGNPPGTLIVSPTERGTTSTEQKKIMQTRIHSPALSVDMGVARMRSIPLSRD